MRKAFTLIELLVVIAIIAILAAILFPVFAQAKIAAKKGVDLSNMNQMGLASNMYLADYDDTFYPHRNNCNYEGGTSAADACHEYYDPNGNLYSWAQGLTAANGDQNSLKRYFWIYMLQPYMHNFAMFQNPALPVNAFHADTISNQLYLNAPGAVGWDYGGQNSYGHNDTYLSPALSFGGGGSVPTPVNSTSIPRPASTLEVVDATYYGASFDAANNSGVTNLSHLNGNELAFQIAAGSQYEYYWQNIGAGTWSMKYAANGPEAYSQSLTDSYAYFAGKPNCQFADGHTKSISYVVLVGDVCYWTTDADGAHPNCGG
jgi:prepilin-type N-terminal cleavage/methylation domain-containing protein